MRAMPTSMEHLTRYFDASVPSGTCAPPAAHYLRGELEVTWGGHTGSGPVRHSLAEPRRCERDHQAQPDALA